MRRENKLWFIIFPIVGILALSLQLAFTIPINTNPAFLRIYLLIHWGVILLLITQYLAIFLYKAIKTNPYLKRETKAVHEQSRKIFAYNFSLAMFYLSFAIGLSLYYISFFYNVDIMNWVFRFMWIALLIMTINFEFTKILKTKWILTTLTSVTLVITTMYDYLWDRLPPFHAIFYVPVGALLIFLLPSAYFLLAIKEKETIRVQSLLFGLGLFFLFSTIFILRHYLEESNLTIIITWFESTLYIPYDLFTTVLILFGYILMAGYGNINFFGELLWSDTLVGLYLYMNASGVSIFNYNFKQSEISEHHLDELLISAGISGIVTVLGEMTDGTESLKTIEQENRKIMIETGKDVTCVLIVQENLVILRNKMEDFLQEVEEIFQDSIKGWRGRLNVFDPAVLLVQKYFEG